jgi:hypothetical protein
MDSSPSQCDPPIISVAYQSSVWPTSQRHMHLLPDAQSVPTAFSWSSLVQRPYIAQCRHPNAARPPTRQPESTCRGLPSHML